MSAARRKVDYEGCCRTCGSLSNLTRHHLVPQSWFRLHPHTPGCHSAANIAPLCDYCHRVLDGCLSSPMPATRAQEKRRLLRATLRPEEIAFILRVRGAEWLERRYPPVTVNHGHSTVV